MEFLKIFHFIDLGSHSGTIILTIKRSRVHHERKADTDLSWQTILIKHTIPTHIPNFSKQMRIDSYSHFIRLIGINPIRLMYTYAKNSFV
jgi:hypothetical protein